MDILKENSSLVRMCNQYSLKASHLLLSEELVKSDGQIVRETYIEQLISENIKFKIESKIHPKISSIQPLEESKRFERKRDKKSDDKSEGLSRQNSQVIPHPPDSMKEQILEKRKNELESELADLKKSSLQEKDQLEAENEALKARINSIATNYQELQKDLQAEKQK